MRRQGRVWYTPETFCFFLLGTGALGLAELYFAVVFKIHDGRLISVMGLRAFPAYKVAFDDECHSLLLKAM